MEIKESVKDLNKNPLVEEGFYLYDCLTIAYVYDILNNVKQKYPALTTVYGNFRHHYPH